MVWQPSLKNYFWLILWPVSWVFAILARLRRKFVKHGYHSYQLKVFCIGNLHSGGSGKTPLVELLATKWKDKGVCILSRGYGGTLSKLGGWVDINCLNGPDLYGDEPWMLAKKTKVPVFVGSDRASAIKCIEKEKSIRRVILDDGFQHLNLSRDVDLVVINTDKEIEEAFMLPLGELREPFSALLAVQVIVLIGCEHLDMWKGLITEVNKEASIFSINVRSDGYYDLSLEPVVRSAIEGIWGAFCGISYAVSFTKMLDSKTCFLKKFPNHHAYSTKDADWLVSEAKKHSLCGFITTEKDLFKIGPLLENMGWPVVALRRTYEVSDDFLVFLENCLE